MPTLRSQPQITTLEQYEALPEDVRAEVFDGLIYDMASPSQSHQTILTELLVPIRNYLREKGGECQVFPAPFDVKLSDSPLTIFASPNFTPGIGIRFGILSSITKIIRPASSSLSPC